MVLRSFSIFVPLHLVFIVFSVFIDQRLSAQTIVNVEAVRPKIDEMGYKAEAKLEFNGSAGNSEKFYTGFGHSSVWNFGVSQQFILMSFRYGESQGVKDANESFLHLRHVKPLAPQRFWETYTQTQTNQFNRLRLRGLIGGGWRWELPESNKVGYAFGVGGYYSHEEIYEVGLFEAEKEDMVRANMYFSLKTIETKQLTSLFIFYFQPRSEQLKDYLLFATSILRVFCTEDLIFSIEATITHDNIPPATVKKTDLNYISSFILKF